MEIKRQGNAQSSVQSIMLPSRATVLDVYCDMKWNGGGWIVIQRRLNGKVSFSRNWQQYQESFGELHGDFWIGLENLHALTSNQAMELRIDLINYHNETGYAEYTTFSVASVHNFYRLNVGGFTGNVGDAMGDVAFPSRVPNGQRFSTFDEDNDPSVLSNCALAKKGGWWYNQCYHCHLNGLFGEAHGDDKHMSWIPWKGNVGDIKFVEMKIRPV